MILDLNMYRINIPGIKLMTENKTPKEREELIGRIALATQCHIVAVEHYLGELYGYTDTLKAKISRDSKWYHLEDVIGIKVE